MDPVETDNEQVNAEHAALEEALKDVEGLRGIHDFRMVMGPSHTNLIFDVVIPYGVPQSDSAVKAALDRRLREQEPNARTVIRVDHSYVL